MNPFYKTKNNIKKDLNDLNNHNKMLYIMVKRTIFCQYLHKVKKIGSNKYGLSSINRSSSYESYSSLSYDSELEVDKPKRRYINSLYHIAVTNAK